MLNQADKESQERDEQRAKRKLENEQKRSQNIRQKPYHTSRTRPATAEHWTFIYHLIVTT